MIHVCSLAALPDTVKATGASHVLTVMANVDQVQRPESVLPADRSTSREGLDFDESTAVDPIQKPAARAIPPQAVIRPQCQRS